MRQDLIADDEGVAEWTDRLQPILTEILDIEGLNEIRHFGSRSG